MQNYIFYRVTPQVQLKGFVASMASKSKKDSTKIELANQIKSFTSIDFVSKTSNVIEKLLWIAIAICGTIWIWSTFASQMESWNEHPVMKNKETLELSEMTSPAISFCPKAISEFAVFEGLGNQLDLDNKPLPSEVLSIRNEVVKMYWRNRMNMTGIRCNMTWTDSMITSLANYYDNCCDGKSWCKVCSF